jgi:flagellar basal-body rod protein FlgB
MGNSMAITDMPLIEALKTKMRWHQARQTLLAENVSNADTPSYRGQDLKIPNFDALLHPDAPATSPARVSVALTTPGHIPGREISTTDGFANDKAKSGFEVRPNGNSVSLEGEMIKSSENQIDFQAATSLYQRSINMFRTAIGQK